MCQIRLICHNLTSQSPRPCRVQHRTICSHHSPRMLILTQYSVHTWLRTWSTSKASRPSSLLAVNIITLVVPSASRWQLAQTPSEFPGEHTSKEKVCTTKCLKTLLQIVWRLYYKVFEDCVLHSVCSKYQCIIYIHVHHIQSKQGWSPSCRDFQNIRSEISFMKFHFTLWTK